MAKSILDPSFKYTPSHSTDITGTFKKYGFAAPRGPKATVTPEPMDAHPAVAAPIPLRRKA
jgi:hypothetical protein